MEIKQEESENTVKVYKIRWLILVLYVMYGIANGTQWVQYCIISNIIEKFYSVSSYLVDWTSLITMVTYPPLLLPSTYIIDKLGLRISALIAVFGTGLGNWIKVVSAEPDLFWVTFLGQTIISLVQPLILCIPPKLAATWFSENEVSRACGIGVFGQYLGTAIGFILPPLMVKNHDEISIIKQELSHLFYTYAIFTSVTAVLVLLFFKRQPTIAPSNAQAILRRKVDNTKMSHQFTAYKKLFLDKPFLVHAICYGLNIGVFVGFCTILNQIVLHYFENSAEDAGIIGLLMVIIGMIGSLLFGILLDKTRKYKEITVTVYFLSAVGIIAFMFSLGTYSKVLIYLSGIIIGFFTNSYYSCGIELGVELSYPMSEATSSGILIGSGQTFGTIIILISGLLLKNIGPFWFLAIMACTSLVGAVITSISPNITKRQEAFKNASELLENRPLKSISTH